MSSEFVFNDQRFASPEAQRDFYARSAHLAPDYRERLDRIMGSVSQFMPEFGKILTFDDAVKHWEQWDAYMAGPHLEFLAQRKAIAENQGEPKRRGRPKSTEPKIPKPKDDKPPAYKPGRPRKRETNAELEEKRQAWHKAVQEWKDAEDRIDAWARQERARIVEAASHAKQQWSEYAAHYRREYARAKGDDKL